MAMADESALREQLATCLSAMVLVILPTCSYCGHFPYYPNRLDRTTLRARHCARCGTALSGR
jgi:hypothetical protein